MAEDGSNTDHDIPVTRASQERKIWTEAEEMASPASGQALVATVAEDGSNTDHDIPVTRGKPREEDVDGGRGDGKPREWTGTGGDCGQGRQQHRP